MNLLDMHFRSGQLRTVKNVDHCRCGDGHLTGYNREGRLILRVLLTSVDWFEVRSMTGFPAGHSGEKTDRLESLSH